MLKVSHSTLVYISGAIWLAVGFFLLQLGLRLMLAPSNLLESSSVPLLSSLKTMAGGIYEAAVALIAISLFIGFLKGKHILRKSARQGVERIRTLPNPTELYYIYNAKYYILLAIMIGLGASMRFLGIPNDIRGGVDIAIGAALINGAVEYFKLGFSIQKSSQQRF
jgi:hypothetical protein